MSSSRLFVLLPLLFFLLLSFECVLLAPNLFSSKIVAFGESGDAFDSPSFADGTSTERFSATESDGRAMAKRNSRMVNALSTILNKRRELGTNDAFRVRIRSLDQMGNTNCYFSPVQCYFFEER